MKTGRIIVFTICITLILVAGYFILNKDNFIVKLLSPKPPLEITETLPSEYKLPDKALSILVLGADSLIPGKLEGWNGRSDLIVVIHFNPHTQALSVLSIPRDTHIELKKHGTNRINAANQIGGYKLARRAVKKLLKLKIDKVVVFSIQAAIELLDAIGPMKIFVPQQMSYHDKSANLHINIDPGLQVMNGQTLMNFLRYRSAKDGDIGRIHRQQIFFRAAMKRFSEPEIVFKLPTILFKANKVFLTDMSFKEMFEFGILLRSLPRDQLQSHIIPGDFGADGSWIVNEGKLKLMMDKVTKYEVNTRVEKGIVTKKEKQTVETI